MSDLSIRRGPAPATALVPVLPLAGRIPAWMQVGLAWLVFLLLRDWPWAEVGRVFTDTDDAMRLVQVRDLLAGQSWFDLVQHRLDPGAPVPSHWSRFVDLPVAALVKAFGLVLPPDAAERLALLAWPPLTFLPVLVAVRAMAARMAGPLAGGWAGIVALVLAVSCLKATWQFFPGRIDHHNVQLALTLALMAVLLRPGDRRASLEAGALAGLMLAVGFETLPFIVVAAATYAWRFLAEPEARAEVAGFGLSLAGFTTFVFLATTPVDRYGIAACDALSVSMLGLAAGGGLALAAATLLAGRTLRQRLLAVAAAGLAALALFAWIEPDCLAGPFAQVDPAIRPAWLDHVDEVQPIRRVWGESHLRALMAVVDPLAALALLPLLLRTCRRQLRAPVLAVGASLLLAVVIGCVQIKTAVYANLLAVPVLAAAVAVLAGRTRAAGGSAPVVLAAGTLLASSTTLAALLSAVPQVQAEGEMGRLAALSDRATCYDSRIYRALAGESRGLVLGFVESGPFILLATAHDTLAAPYHRNGHGVVAGARILAAQPGEAERLARDQGVDLLALCTQSSTLQRLRDDSAGALALRLVAGETPPWLEAIPTGTPALLAYRVKPIRQAAPPAGGAHAQVHPVSDPP